jgi:hypothetical protein
MRNVGKYKHFVRNVFRKRLWFILRYYTGIRLEGLWKTAQYLVQGGEFLRRYSNLVRRKYK